MERSRRVHELRREPRTIEVSRDHIVVPDVEMDPEFGKLYEQHLRGELLVGYTRVSTARIQTGFMRKSQGKTRMLVEPGKDESYIRVLTAHLHGGARPYVYLYRAKKGERPYVCSDDVNLMEAYRAAGIALVPAAILDPEVSLLEEGCLTFSCGQSPQGPFRLLVGTLCPDYTTVASILGGEYVGRDAATELRRLESAAETGLARLRQFHWGHVESTHYHHTLASVLFRTSRILRGVRVLCGEHLIDQALILVRSLYEMSLSLYVDWLCPDVFGQHFVWHAQLDREGRKALWDEIDKNRLNNGWTQDSVRALRKSWERMQELVGSPSKRAALSRFKEFHPQFYHRLSSPAHQDFEMTARYAAALSRDCESVPTKADSEADIAFLLKCADLAVASICAVVSADIGAKRTTGTRHQIGVK